MTQVLLWGSVGTAQPHSLLLGKPMSLSLGLRLGGSGDGGVLLARPALAKRHNSEAVPATGVRREAWSQLLVQGGASAFPLRCAG